tara:strand:- start:1121 stop:1744 length:624 start_codon:yes stop_codon:yes gene_type:complete
MSDIRVESPPTTKILFGRKGDMSMAMLFLGNGIILYFCFGTFAYYIENALFEACQDIYLFGAGVLYFVAAHRSGDPVSKLFWLALCMSCMSVLFRELDPRGTNVEFLLQPIFDLRLHYVFLGVIWVPLFVLSVPYRRSLFGALWQWFFSFSAVLLLIGILFYIGGDIAEKSFFSGDYLVSEMIEESMELIGTFIIFFSAYAALRRQA